MRAVRVGALCALLVACVGDATSGDGGADATTDGLGGNDVAAEAMPEAGPACNLAKPFGAPMPVAELNVNASDVLARLTHDELTVYFDRSAAADAGPEAGTPGYHLLTAARPNVTSPFGAASFLAIDQVNSADPSPTGDDLTLYFSSDRDGGQGAGDIWVATRTSNLGPFTNPTDVLGINSSSGEDQGYVMPDNLTIYFASDRSGNLDLYRATRTMTTSFTLDMSGVFAAVNTSSQEWFPVVTVDQLTVYFGSDRTGGQGLIDVWKATRSSPSDPFGAPVNVMELNTPRDDRPSWISDDGCRIYLSSFNGSAYNVYLAIKPST